MRSEFEKLPIIQEIMADEYDGLMFDERFSKYLCPSDGNEEYLNGAWMVWQQRQTEVDELQKRVDDLTELNRLKTIALQQSVNRTSPYVHEKIVALEQALKGGSDASN